MKPVGRAAAGLQIAYRPETESDQSFVASLYASTRASEFAALNWPEAALTAFLDQQHRAQQRHFRAVFPDGEWLIVEQSGQRIGRLYLNETGDHLHLVDIILRPESRGTGIGTAIVADLIDQAHRAGKPVRLSVDKTNLGAARLYRRLGFDAIDDQGMRETMICRPRVGRGRSGGRLVFYLPSRRNQR